MTDIESGSLPDAEAVGLADSRGEKERSARPVTPWSTAVGGRRRISGEMAPLDTLPSNGQPIIGGGRAQEQNALSSLDASTTEQNAGTAMPTVSASSAPVQQPPVGAVSAFEAQTRHGLVTSESGSPTGAAAQSQSPGASASSVDAELAGKLAPMAFMVGTMALPTIASALAGLAGGGVRDGEAETAGAGGGLSPESQKALHVLNSLAAAYGDGSSEHLEVKPLPRKVSAGTGSGDAAIAMKAKQLYLANAAEAFNNVDNRIASYLQSMAGSHNIDKKAIEALLREVNVALAELKWQAYTKAGRQKVRDVLTAALQKGQRIVAATQADAMRTAAAINRLSDQYLYDILGRSAPPRGASSAAHKAVQVAKAQLGDPYIWGAEGPNAFDCSGLMQYAAAKAGIRIPRVAAAQYQQLPKVRPSDIRPGDLIFPAKQFNGGSPKHVMMYIGNGKCISAPYSGAVVHITPLPRSYHATRFA